MIETVEKYIDAPIRKTVAGLNLLGFKTYMSCCGFTYDGEQIEKSHLPKVYVFLDSEQVLKDQRLSSFLTNLSLRAGWTAKLFGKFIDFYYEDPHFRHPNPWADPKSIHNYEQFLLGIHKLNRGIEDFSGEFFSYASIEDGNKYYYDNVSKFWKIKPAANWLVKREDWAKIPA